MMLGPISKIIDIIKSKKMPKDAEEQIIALIDQAQRNSMYHEDLHGLMMNPKFLEDAVDKNFQQVASFVLSYQEQQEKQRLGSFSKQEEKRRATSPQKVTAPKEFRFEEEFEKKEKKPLETLIEDYKAQVFKSGTTTQDMNVFMIEVRKHTAELFHKLQISNPYEKDNIDTIKNVLKSIAIEARGGMGKPKLSEAFISRIKKYSKEYKSGGYAPSIQKYDDYAQSDSSESHQEHSMSSSEEIELEKSKEKLPSPQTHEHGLDLVVKTSGLNKNYKPVHWLTRAFGYKESMFDQFSRSPHRSYEVGSTQPNFSVAAAKKAIERYNQTHKDRER